VSRTARRERVTSESSVTVDLDLDGTGDSTISTGVRFYDHMLTSLARHSLIDLQVTATGDVDVDAHHTVEDTAIVLGQARSATNAASPGSVTRWCRSTRPWRRPSSTSADAPTACAPGSRKASSTR
jgi:imidazoleglycerol phosphate dehydratase HisB